MKYEFFERSKFNLEEYKQNLDGKIEYIKNIYPKMSNNTILLVTSDSGNVLYKLLDYLQDSKNDPKPLLITKENSKKLDVENTIIEKIIRVEDLCSTNSSLMGFDIPSFNQGNFIDEIILSNKLTKNNLDLNYLILFHQKHI